ncbi:MAG: hypothetical protein ACI35P_02000 [Bacillus sp. (in: firmicutes)]
MNTDFFLYDRRLNLYVPNESINWEQLSIEEQQCILLEWENIRGSIPDRIHQIEEMIQLKQAQLEVEDNFNTSCTLNAEIAELASQINDLWLWFRTQQDIDPKMHT